jgi:thiamine biosynthesis lipoprotein
MADNCMDADAWATALMVLGVRSGAELAKELRLNAIFIERTNEALRQSRVGWKFGGINSDCLLA